MRRGWRAWRCTMARRPALPFEPQPDDRRFGHPGWRKAPYYYFAQAFLAQEALVA